MHPYALSWLIVFAHAIANMQSFFRCNITSPLKCNLINFWVWLLNTFKAGKHAKVPLRSLI
uniref:Transmembrane protein n=1 Tax=Medicago truncatula TaxID=3880 RepID=I3SV29_MEDTR|nr:unknown [Medicago truncatula]